MAGAMERDQKGVMSYEHVMRKSCNLHSISLTRILGLGLYTGWNNVQRCVQKSSTVYPFLTSASCKSATTYVRQSSFRASLGLYQQRIGITLVWPPVLIFSAVPSTCAHCCPRKATKQRWQIIRGRHKLLIKQRDQV